MLVSNSRKTLQEEKVARRLEKDTGETQKKEFFFFGI